ncbi:MAG: alpha/beta hydrolase [Chloroflexota bacterium]
MKILRRILIGLLILLVLMVAGLFTWATVSARPATERALQTLSDNNITREDGLLVFQPDTQPTLGLIYYPGGLVDPEAYAVSAQGIADAGYLVVIPKMALNLAVTGINKADDIIDKYPEIDSWVIGGHSLGGAMAAEYAKNNANVIDGMILYASFPASSEDYINVPFDIFTIYGSEESGAPEMAAFYDIVADSAEEYVIDGGNHAQFGDYGLQGGDGTATISPADQQEQIVEQTVLFLESIQ